VATTETYAPNRLYTILLNNLKQKINAQLEIALGENKNKNLA
jgi:hypothetical protein